MQDLLSEDLPGLEIIPHAAQGCPIQLPCEGGWKTSLLVQILGSVKDCMIGWVCWGLKGRDLPCWQLVVENLQSNCLRS